MPMRAAPAFKETNKMVRCAVRFCVAAFAFVPVAASAHVGVGDTHGFAHGFLHPLSGIDHPLAMVAVGLFAACLGGRALWLVPLSFVSVMALAGIAGSVGIKLPFVEIGIGMSIVALGLAVALQLSVPTLVAMGPVLSAPLPCFTQWALAWVLRSARQAKSTVVGLFKSAAV